MLKYFDRLLWQPYGIGQAIIFLPRCFFYLLLLLFLAYSQLSYIGCVPYFHTWCGFRANLECRSEMCCTRLAEKMTQKSQKNSPSAHHHTTLLGCVFANKAHIDNRKNLLNSNISSTCFHNMVNVGPLTAEIGSVVLGTPANFNGFRVLPSLLQGRRSPEANQTLHDVWPSPGLVIIYR